MRATKQLNDSRKKRRGKAESRGVAGRRHEDTKASNVGQTFLSVPVFWEAVHVYSGAVHVPVREDEILYENGYDNKARRHRVMEGEAVPSRKHRQTCANKNRQ